MEKDLMRRAGVLFPRTQYTDPATVRHARRQWLRTVGMLRSASGGCSTYARLAFPKASRAIWAAIFPQDLRWRLDLDSSEAHALTFWYEG